MNDGEFAEISDDVSIGGKMTDPFIEKAREIVKKYGESYGYLPNEFLWIEYLSKALQSAVENEREECAKYLESQTALLSGKFLARAIRFRSGDKSNG